MIETDITQSCYNFMGKFMKFLRPIWGRISICSNIMKNIPHCLSLLQLDNNFNSTTLRPSDRTPPVTYVRTVYVSIYILISFYCSPLLWMNDHTPNKRNAKTKPNPTYYYSDVPKLCIYFKTGFVFPDRRHVCRLVHNIMGQPRRDG